MLKLSAEVQTSVVLESSLPAKTWYFPKWHNPHLGQSMARSCTSHNRVGISLFFPQHRKMRGPILWDSRQMRKMWGTRVC